MDNNCSLSGDSQRLHKPEEYIKIIIIKQTTKKMTEQKFYYVCATVTHSFGSSSLETWFRFNRKPTRAEVENILKGVFRDSPERSHYNIRDIFFSVPVEMTKEELENYLGISIED
jgi:hypothetical protein